MIEDYLKARWARTPQETYAERALSLALVWLNTFKYTPEETAEALYSRAADVYSGMAEAYVFVAELIEDYPIGG